MDRVYVARELVEVAKLVSDASRRLTARRVTKATVKSFLRKQGLSADQYELDSTDVTFWPENFDADDRHRGRDMAEKAAEKLAKSLGAPLSSNGSKFWVTWKGAGADKGDWNDPSSKWHY